MPLIETDTPLSSQSPPLAIDQRNQRHHLLRCQRFFAVGILCRPNGLLGDVIFTEAGEKNYLNFRTCVFYPSQKFDSIPIV
ncbi:MAG: hypothetical protein ACLFVT_03820, partial [Syntrophobacteria bacterium]